ncbi:unnamed protein product, partial [Rotaria magnacalcarata]
FILGKHKRANAEIKKIVTVLLLVDNEIDNMESLDILLSSNRNEDF